MQSIFSIQLLLVSSCVLQISAHATVARCADVRVRCPAGRHCEDTPTGVTCAPDPVCPPNEVFNICASDCEQTCVAQGRPCSNICLTPRCQCQKGFVRENGICIRTENCPERLGFTTSRSYVDEPFTPTSSGCDLLLVRILCIPGLHCEVVGGEPRCVPDQTPPPEHLACERLNCPVGQHCEFYDGGVVECAPNPGPCAGAFCVNSTCIEYDNTIGCFNTNCGQNEEFRTCASCEPTCGPVVPCLDVCQTPACQCIAGYVRHQGRCIERSTCKHEECWVKCEDDYIEETSYLEKCPSCFEQCNKRGLTIHE